MPPAARVRSVLRPIYRRIEAVLLWILPARTANVLQTSVVDWSSYFAVAEGRIETEWQKIIWPRIETFDFDVVLELAVGRGRSTERLCRHARKLYAVDVNSNTIAACRRRLRDASCGCDVVFVVNNGKDLRRIDSGSISTIYCWDSAVHFSREILAGYIGEFARVLKPGGKGFVHHSNLGDGARRNIKSNPHWRSTVDNQFVARACRAHGLIVESQTDIPWGGISDSATVFVKSSS